MSNRKPRFLLKTRIAPALPSSCGSDALFQVFTVFNGKVIIVTDEPTARKLLGSCRDSGSLPQ